MIPSSWSNGYGSYDIVWSKSGKSVSAMTVVGVVVNWPSSSGSSTLVGRVIRKSSPDG